MFILRSKQYSEDIGGYANGQQGAPDFQCPPLGTHQSFEHEIVSIFNKKNPMNPVLTKQCPQKRKCSDASPAFGVVIDTATLRCFILNE